MGQIPSFLSNVQTRLRIWVVCLFILWIIGAIVVLNFQKAMEKQEQRIYYAQQAAFMANQKLISLNEVVERRSREIAESIAKKALEDAREALTKAKFLETKCVNFQPATQ